MKYNDTIKKIISGVNGCALIGEKYVFKFEYLD